MSNDKIIMFNKFYYALDALFPELPHSDVPLVSALNISKTYFTAVWEKIANAVSYKLVLRNNQNIRELLVRYVYGASSEITYSMCSHC